MTTLPELLKQRADLDAQIAAHKAEMVAQVRAVMASLGVTLEDLGGSPPAGGQAKRPVKYRDEKGNTWTGIGQRPRWLKARILAGASLDDFGVR